MEIKNIKKNVRLKYFSFWRVIALVYVKTLARSSSLGNQLLFSIINDV